MNELEHRAGCADPAAVGTFTGRHGDELERCRACGALRVLATAGAPVEAERVDAQALARGRYRCRTHPHRPVTWKGTGCPDCASRDRRGA